MDFQEQLIMVGCRSSAFHDKLRRYAGLLSHKIYINFQIAGQQMNKRDRAQQVIRGTHSLRQSSWLGIVE